MSNSANVFMPLAYNLMAKPIGSVCNLNCSYCYYLEKSRLYEDSRDMRMSEEVLTRFIEQYITTQNIPEITFVWQGGEPTLLGIDYYKNILSIQSRFAGNKKIINALQTNGTLLNDEWCAFLHKNDFLVGISIDGPKKYHDKNRVTKTGESTFDKVMQGIALLKKHEVEFNTLSVVNSYNVDSPLEIYHFLKEIGSGYIQFLPVVEFHSQDPNQKLKLVNPDFKGEIGVGADTVDPIKYGYFLNAIFDEWVRNDVGRYYIQLFDVTLANWVGEMPGLCVFSETCGDATVIEHNGDIYACDHFVFPEYKLGNILSSPVLSLVKSTKQLEFGANKLKKLPKYCIDCDVRFACHGECPKHRFASTPDGEKGLAYLCPSYKSFFHHVWPQMQFMAEELRNKRAPANIMQHLRNTENAKQTPVSISLKVGRNDTCTCGSGKKFKHCCGKK